MMMTKSTFAFVTMLVATSALSMMGCADEASTDDDAQETAVDEPEAIARSIENELALLGGSNSDVEKLGATIGKRIASLESKKAKAKEQAGADIAGYSEQQWTRSWFTREESDAAISARSKDIFDRPERRALDGSIAQKAIVDQVLALHGEGRAGNSEPTPEVEKLREAYLELALSIAMNGDLGLLAQVPPRILQFLRKSIFRFLRDRPDNEAVDVEGSAGADLFRKDPIGSSMWQKRSAEQITPAVLFRGPWYRAEDLPKLPAANETWDLVGFRSQKSDGAHASVDIGLPGGDAEVKLKLHTDPATGFWTEPAYARLLWAMGYETDPQYLLTDTRLQPRAFLAAHASIARVGLKIGNKEDEVIPGRPPRGLSVALNGLSKAPGAGWVTVRYRDGREEGGEDAIDSLRRAMDDAPLMNSMESVVVKRSYVELDRPGKWNSIGPWDFDTDNHVDDRAVRSLALVMVAWLGSDDLKFNNLRLDAEKSGKISLVLADVGKEKVTTSLPWDVGIRTDGRFLHPDTNAYGVKAFDRMTMNDAKWGVLRIGALTEDQIVACVAAGAFDDQALAVYTEKLLARRDEIVKTFGLANELGLLRPNGANRNPAPRHFTP